MTAVDRAMYFLMGLIIGFSAGAFLTMWWLLEEAKKLP